MQDTDSIIKGLLTIGNMLPYVSMAIGIGGIITIPMMLINDKLSKGYKIALMIALVGFLLPMVLVILLFIADKTTLPWSTNTQHAILISVFAAAMSFHIAFFNLMPKKVESHNDKLSMAIQILVYAGLGVEIMFLAAAIIFIALDHYAASGHSRESSN